MFSILKSLAIGFLSVAQNVTMNNTEFIEHHNALNLSYSVTENKFINTEYVNEFSVSLGSQGREAIVKVFDYCNISSTNIFVK